MIQLCYPCTVLQKTKQAQILTLQGTMMILFQTRVILQSRISLNQFRVCVLIDVCRDDKSNNDDLFSFTCPMDNVKLDCRMVSICPLTSTLIILFFLFMKLFLRSCLSACLCSQDTFPDKATERKILSLIIQCPNSSCEWTGPLGEKEVRL